jgi:hypothetical protein
MGCELDRRCAAQQRELQTKIAQCERLLRARGMRKRSTLAARVLAMRNEWVIELHDMQRAHDAYDRRLAAAYDDPTGQDLDAFYDRYGEGDSPARMEY